MTDVLLPWDSWFGGDVNQFFRGQYGSCLVKQYDGVTDWSSWTPFDPETGEIAAEFCTNGVFRDGFLDLGYGDKAGIKFTKTWTRAASDPWQGRRDEDPTITKQAEKGVFTALQSNPVIDAIQEGLPLASVQRIGTAGYGYSVPRFPIPNFYTTAFMALRVTKSGLVWMKWRLFTCAEMLTPGETEWSGENGEKALLTFEPDECQVSGTAVVVRQDGPGWRTLGGATTPPGTPVAAASGGGTVTLSFTAPQSQNEPFTYVAFRNGSNTPLTPTTVGGTEDDPILTLSAQTTGAATYTVQATGGNGTSSAQSSASNSVTVT